MVCGVGCLSKFCAEQGENCKGFDKVSILRPKMQTLSKYVSVKKKNIDQKNLA